MYYHISCIILLFISFESFAQLNPNTDKHNVAIEMLFPEGKSKALILSYDDGHIQDRQLVQLMNKYNLIGTFHLNSSKLDLPDFLTKNEIKQLFEGHEVSVHSCNHPYLTNIPMNEVRNEILNDRKELERIVKYPVRGMAYPFGNYNQEVIETIQQIGIEYARTIEDSYKYSIPSNFLKWEPTIHQFSKAFWEPNQPKKDSIEMAFFDKIISDFLASESTALLDIWGHSWEMGTDSQKWQNAERFFERIANNSQINYTKQIDLVDYIYAYRQLKFSVDKTLVFNPSASTLYFKFKETTFKIKPGETLKL